MIGLIERWLQHALRRGGIVILARVIFSGAQPSFLKQLSTFRSEYGYVIIGSVIVPTVGLMMMGGNVMEARKKYNVKYPNLYAVPGVHKDADAFNQVQRGHQNAMETFPSVLAMLLVGGLKHPLACAAGGVIWTIGMSFLTFLPSSFFVPSATCNYLILILGRVPSEQHGRNLSATHTLVYNIGPYCTRPTETGRYLYMVGYTEDSNKRYGKGGAIHWIGFLTALISSGKLAYDLVNAK